jgi:hypothetical protein
VVNVNLGTASYLAKILIKLMDEEVQKYAPSYDHTLFGDFDVNTLVELFRKVDMSSMYNRVQCKFINNIKLCCSCFVNTDTITYNISVVYMKGVSTPSIFRSIVDRKVGAPWDDGESPTSVINALTKRSILQELENKAHEVVGDISGILDL